MSYILDALKKSDKRRQRGAVPGVLTVQDIAEPEQKNRLIWPYVVTAALLLNVGIFAWWLAPWRSKSPAAVGQSTARKLEASRKAAAHAVTATERKTAHKDEQPASNRANKGTQVPASAGIYERPQAQSSDTTAGDAVKVEPAVRHDGPAPVQSTQSVSRPAPEQKPAEAVIPSPENKIYNLTELPPPLRQSLPQLTISTHIYSGDPASRMIRIGGQTFREGQDVATGLKLEEITADGVICRYHDYRFRLNVR